MARGSRRAREAEEADAPARISAELREDLDESRGPRRDSGSEALRKRISYFMLFRLGLIAAFTLLASYTTWLVEDHTVGLRDWLTWATIAVGYVLTLVFAWQLRPDKGPIPRRRLERIAAIQTGFDLVMAATAVLLTGGVESGFVFLFLIAVLGAATMGKRGQIWASAAIGGALYFAISMAQFLGWLRPFHDPGEVLAAVDASRLWFSLLRTGGAIALVAILSAYLNNQLLSSVSQVGSLRTLNENIVRSLTSGLLTVDQAGRVLFTNPTARELLGRSGNLSGLDCEELLPGLRPHLEDSGGFRNRFELNVDRLDDNRRVNLGLSCSPLLDERGQFLGHVINFQDVTEVREMERILRRNERLAAIGGLAASVAHEVRNPLAAIAGCAELLEADLEGEEDQRLIRIIRRESARLADIVSELLDYTRPRRLQRDEIELGKVLRELADSFRADPANAKIELVLSVPDEPLRAKLDLAQLTQVLWNLVRNGAQAMDNQGRLELGVTSAPLTSSGGDERVRLHVRDHGRGIPPEDLDRIFEPFYSTKEGGSGIGLALVHRIIEDHGGDIQVHSAIGEGTSFLITLPTG